MHPLSLLAALAIAAPDDSAPPPPPVTIAESAAIERFDLRRRLDTYGAGARKPDARSRVEVVEGDLRVAGDLLLDDAHALRRVDALRARAPGDRVGARSDDVVGLIVTGDLVVDGAIINANLNWGTFLLVLGETRARAMFVGGAELRFEGRARFGDAVVGCYNDGMLRFAGGLDAPLVISEDHAIDIAGADVAGEPAPEVIDPFNGEGDLERLRDALEPAIVVADIDAFDVKEALLPRIRRGERVLRRR